MIRPVEVWNLCWMERKSVRNLGRFTAQFSCWRITWIIQRTKSFLQSWYHFWASGLGEGGGGLENNLNWFAELNYWVIGYSQGGVATTPEWDYYNGPTLQTLSHHKKEKLQEYSFKKCQEKFIGLLLMLYFSTIVNHNFCFYYLYTSYFTKVLSCIFL